MHEGLECGAFVLCAMSKAAKFRRHAIVGIYGSEPPFVQHAALLQNDQEVDCAKMLPLNHMGPPIEYSAKTCDLIAQIDLTNEEIEALDDWLAGVATQYCDVKVTPLQQYIVCPHMQWVLSEDGARIRQRFSCVGFVVEAYRAADIEIINEESVPFAERQLLSKAYPVFERCTQNQTLARRLGFVSLDDLGLSGDGPWRIALAGYLFHSIDRYPGSGRPTAYIPAGVEDSRFPNSV